ncbi:uncharacterized protein LOC130700201 [Daphnia carinata]|uniref:uncharacterized protein LOC130700201 n=1 Tax=Daphnia carinata TaxID=120202 RepID=UPI002579EC54|nr:uncharacterized protein LOC130700201 [Daphnia carinata]XP_059352497.1 uncharacterized protein LOC130700201 [Daphnia carinata]
MIIPKLERIVLLAVLCLLPIICADPSEVNASGRKMQQRFIRDYQDTTDVADLLATTVEPELPTGDLPTVQEEGRNPYVATEAAPVETSSPEALLFYPPVSVDQPKYRPATHYAPPADPSRGGKVSTSKRPFGLGVPKLRQLGFPPISNTRENVGQQVNWEAKIGRAHGSFHEFLLA